ncbi:IpaD/SipD/SspD family type III secretion system needle tip protein [Stenotrophomonas sp.]|uniref:IpaD/SipD/SspD family type III secretion system needle tip protein n=1 Tax=Stenotrophomonas sp. TaxID=69392 RepID=UPI0028B22DFB|nr:IpaD/SipD/SspD family type III secretion system needle tip protein [Stenotrophomonas sp.]
MSISIQPTALVSPRHAIAHAVAASQLAPELPPVDAATCARLSQAQVFLDNAHHAWSRQAQAVQRYTAQLAASLQFGHAVGAHLGLQDAASTLAPHHAEVLLHPDIIEELKKHRERESRLAAALGDAIDESRRPMHDLLRVLGFLDFGHTREERPAESTDPIINPADKDASGLIWNSHSEFYEQIGLLLAALKENWLSKYQDAMKTFLEFYEEFQDILEKLKISGSGDKGDVAIYAKAVKDGLTKLMQKYGMDDKALASFSSEAQAQAFVENMGLPGLKATPGPDGTYVVKIDLSAVEAIRDSLPTNPTFPNPGGDPIEFPVTWDSAKYNAWVSNKDGNVEQIKHMSKVLGEKLSETTQQFDNIVKILSSTIDKINDADMTFVNGL